MKYLLNVVLVLTVLAGCSNNNRKTADQVAEERLSRFYSDVATSDVMNEPLPKFAAGTSEQVFPNSFLKSKNLLATNSPLLQNAQIKGTPEFQAAYCKNVLSKHFPGIQCSSEIKAEAAASWGDIQPNDKPEDLTDTWVDDFQKSLSKIPASGDSKVKNWSDDYWKTQYGGTSYRYGEGKSFDNYKEAVGSYSQPKEWDKLYNDLSFPELAKKVLDWSPAEKYDLTTGDEKFSLTKQQKEAGAEVAGSDGDVESWMGICHGWSAASIMVPAPTKSVTVKGAQGTDITWYPHDIRAMASLAWANGTAAQNFIGGRCDSKKPETYPNGRLKQQDCFDNNPATFHLVLGNQIGIAKESFVMDATFDYEVWNQPVQSYKFTYFNPNDPSKKSTNWKEVMVSYDDAFKKKDRFQEPLTRGKMKNGKYDDSKVKSIVGVMANVKYAAEVDPEHGPSARAVNLVEVTYEYDLELAEEDGDLVPVGGEWHNNTHPDFLWVPKKGEVVSMSADRTDLNFTGKKAPAPEIAKAAVRGSENAYPLCQVLSVLVSESSGKKYECK